MAEPTEPIPGLNRWHGELRAAGVIVAAAVTPMLAVDELVRAGWRPRWDDGTKPPAGLPAVLSSVDDVARVCESAELTETNNGRPDFREWRGGGVRVTAWIDDDVPMCTGVSPDPRPLNNTGHADLWPGTSVLTMWSAIQAARGGEHRG